MNNITLKFFIISSIILVYLVIFAGSIVRVTESGMGCPDWPKCFGYIIPPSEISDLEWKGNHKYNSRQIIIRNNSLLIANNDFISNEKFNAKMWVKYKKHDYVKFNATHTWIEFLNRLLGAIAGLTTLFVFIFSFREFKKNKKIFFLSLLILLGMCFQAWLGKLVVDSNLMPFKVSIHMIVAFLILFVLIYLYFVTSKRSFNSILSKKNKAIVFFAFILTIIQIFIGTQVRQFIDIQIDSFGQNKKEMWLNSPPFEFYFHRSFSIILFITNTIIYYTFKKNNWNDYWINWIMIILGTEIFIGILMYYFSFPFSTQPIHLILSAFLFGIQGYLLLNVFKPVKNEII